MRPRAYFVAKVAVLALVAVAIVLVSIFLLNFILFSIRISSQDALLGFGARGLAAFLALFPWGLLIIDVLLIAGAQWLVREFKAGYTLPISYVLMGLLAAVIVGGAFLDRAGLNDQLLERFERDELHGPLGDLYKSARILPPPGRGVCQCLITSINGNTLQVKDLRSAATLTVIIPTDDPHATTSGLSVGDVVFVAGDGDGDEDDMVIRAFGIRKLPPPPPHI